MPLRVTFAEPMSTGQVPSTGGCALEMDGHSMGDRELEEFEEYLLSFDVLPTHEPLADIEAYLNSLNDHRAVTPQKTASASEVSQASPTSVMEEITGWEETIDAENGLTKAALLAPEPSSTPSPEPKADVSKSTTPDFAVLLEFAVQAAAAATTIQRWWKKPGEELEDTPERCYLLWVRQLVDRRLNAWQLQHTTKENEARYFCRESIRMQRDMFSKKTNWYSEKELQEHIIECFNDDWPVTSSLANCRDPLEYYDHVPGSALYKVTREFLEILDDFSKELETKEAVIEAECNAIYEPIIPYEQWLGRYKVISAVQDAPALDMSVKVSPIFRPLNRSLTVRKWSALIFLCEDYPNFKDPHPKSRFVFLDSVAKHHHEKAVSNQVVYKRESACNIEAAVTAGKQIKHTSEAPRQSGAINQLYPNHGLQWDARSDTAPRQLIYYDHDDDFSRSQTFPSRRSSPHSEVFLKMTTPDTKGIKMEEKAQKEDPGKLHTEPETSGKREHDHCATTHDVVHQTAITNEPFYEERRERSLLAGPDRVVLSGHSSYARVGEIDRVAKTFEYPDQKAYGHMQFELPDNYDHDRSNAHNNDDYSHDEYANDHDQGYDDDYDYNYDEGGGGDDQSSSGDSRDGYP